MTSFTCLRENISDVIKFIVILNLTGIRGLAAIWVVIYHFQAYLKDVFGELKWLSPIIDRGAYGVDLFFCLSGFILAYVYFERFLSNPKKGKEIHHFFLKRFARLYPVYLVTTLVALFMILYATFTGHEFRNFSDESLSYSNVFRNIAAIQILDLSPSLNYPSWSVSAEFFAYLFFPLLVYGLFVKCRSTKLMAWILLLFSMLVYQFQIFFDFFHNGPVVKVLTEFAMGLSCYLLIKRVILPTKYISFIRFLATIFFIIFLYAIENDQVIGAFLPIFLLAIISVNYSHNIPNKGLGRKVFVKLGLWSYSLYLTHGLIHYALGGFDLPVRTNVVLLNHIQLLMIFCIIFLTAKLTTEVVENPCRRYLMKRFI
jgi:peptidoglycan/LPS O-acetylase OafA/YrhL